MVSNTFVVLLGLGTVFSGLVVIILLCKLMSFFVTLTDKENQAVQSANSSSPTVQPVNSNVTIENKPLVLAAIAATVAEELGTDISNIRIHSIKRV